MRTSSVLAVLGLLGACGATPRGGGTTPPSPPPPVVAEVEVRAVEASALPYAIVDARTGRAVAEADFWAALRDARAVCVGEEHPNSYHHWAQLTVVDHLSAAAGEVAPGRSHALGLEMLQSPFQGVVTDYQGQVIDEAAFLSRTGWAARWSYDFALYRPMLERARAAGWALLALNAPSELVKRVGKVGVAGLDAAERAQLPDLKLDDPRHKAWFAAVMAEMGSAHGHGAATAGAAPPPGMPTPENMYAAQVVWDESMAAGAHRWLDTGGAIVVLAGNGHCHDSAVVGRLRRRGVTGVVSVRPIVDDGDGNIADALLERANDYLFVMTMPATP